MTVANTLRNVLVACAVWHSAAGQAQLVNKVQHLLARDSLAPAKFDTSYVRVHRNSLVLSGVVANQGFGVDIEDKQGGTLSYATNTAVQYGFAVDLNWLSVEA